MSQRTLLLLSQDNHHYERLLKAANLPHLRILRADNQGEAEKLIGDAHILMAEPARVESILRAGAEKARPKSRALMQTLRDAVGLRSLARAASGGAQGKAAATDKSAAPPVVKQYREKDGLFYVKLADARGETLLHSSGFASGREAGEALARLKREGAAALSALAGRFERAAGVEEARVTQALARLGED